MQLFPTGIGWRDFSRTVDEGRFACPGSRCVKKGLAKSHYKVKRSRTWITIFWIPVIPLGASTEFLKCMSCKDLMPTYALREQANGRPETLTDQYAKHRLEDEQPRQDESQPPPPYDPSTAPKAGDPAGWYPDWIWQSSADGRQWLRFWDGTKATTQTLPKNERVEEAPIEVDDSQCSICGTDRTNNDSSLCNECGAVFTDRTSNRCQTHDLTLPMATSCPACDVHVQAADIAPPARPRATQP